MAGGGGGGGGGRGPPPPPRRRRQTHLQVQRMIHLQDHAGQRTTLWDKRGIRLY